MTDLNELSNEELMQIAGLSDAPAASDLSSLSNDELFKIAGITPPSIASPAPASPTWGQATEYVLKSIPEGLGNTADLVQSLNPATRLASAITGQKDTAITDLVHSIFGKPEDSGVGGEGAEIFKQAVKAATVPIGGPVANALAGAGSEIAHQIAPDSAIAPIVGALGGGVTASAGRGVANLAKSMGRGFERASLGTSASDFTRSQKVNGLLAADEAGAAQTRLSQAIDEIGDTVGWGVNRTAPALAGKADTALTDLGPKIGGVLTAADDAGAVVTGTRMLSPEGATQKVITSAKAERQDMQKAFDEFKAKFFDPVDGWNGTVSDLNKWKSSVANMAFSGSAEGTLTANATRKLQRAIQKDLGSEVNNAVIQSGVIDPTDWAKLMRTYGNWATVAPMLERNAVKGEAGTVEKGLRTALRTSGGVLTTPTIIGSAIGGAAGGLPGLVAGAALGALGTQTGRGLAGSALKAAGNLGQAVLPTAREAITTAPIAAIATREVPDLTNLFSALPPAQAEEGDSKSRAVDETLSTLLTKPAMKQDIKAIEEQIDQDPYYSALYETESGRNPKAKNPKSSASGGFQFINATAKALGVDNPMDLGSSFSAVKTLTEQHKDEFGTDPIKLYAAHFMGATLLRKWVNGSPLSEKEQGIVNDFENVAMPRFARIYDKVLQKSGGSTLV